MVRIINIDTKNKTIRVSNGDKELEWFTTDTGSHVPLKKGQSKAEAIKEHFGDKKITKKGSVKQPSTPGTAAYHYERADALAKMIETREKELKSDKLLPAAKQAIRDGIAELQLAISKHWDEAGKLEKASKQPAKQAKGTDEDGRVWIKMGGAIIPLRDGVSADDIDPKMLATPEEIKRGRAKYEGIKDRQDATRAKAKSSKIMRE